MVLLIKFQVYSVGIPPECQVPSIVLVFLPFLHSSWQTQFCKTSLGICCHRLIVTFLVFIYVPYMRELILYLSRSLISLSIIPSSIAENLMISFLIAENIFENFVFEPYLAVLRTCSWLCVQGSLSAGLGPYGSAED